MALFENLLGRASGSLGNLVFSHNKGGPYLRQKVTPTNPNSTWQQTVRNAVTNLTSRWLNVLTDDNRAAWATYAANVTVLNRLGNPVHISALAHYVRSNVPRIQCGGGIGAVVDDGPNEFNLGAYTEPVCVVSGATTVTVTVNQPDEWYTEAASFMAVYASRPQNPTINYFKGPYRKCDIPVWGQGAGNLTLPVGFDAVQGKKTFFFARVSRDDGRLSSEWRGFDTANII